MYNSRTKKYSQSDWIPHNWFFFKVCLGEKKKGLNMKYHFPLIHLELLCTEKEKAPLYKERSKQWEQSMDVRALYWTSLFIKILIQGETQFSWCQQPS